ncbi:unnamed protein product [Pseudo-nitzschia multistriata]|uniref:Uncharacterized protein n=1 Tax=Pseudo-nitzschia multistriata TaxID=183589 RepID=A0A448ZG70_9STRA|nr:unnamed protein product [Pseudo-nitzschia multistriata]
MEFPREFISGDKKEFFVPEIPNHTNRSIAIAALAFLLLLPVPASHAAVPAARDESSYNCPKYFESQTLGIQNVVRQPPASSPPAALLSNARGNTSKTSGSLSSYCPASQDGGKEYNRDEEEYSVRGLIYLPSNNRMGSSMDNGKSRNQQNPASSSLIVTVRTSENPSSSIPLMGARIPLAQIESFPISFVLSESSNNFLMADRSWERSVLDASNDLYVTAKICLDDGARGDPPLFEGSGISRKILVPSGLSENEEDGFRAVRGAASIRMAGASVPDALYTW